MRIEPLAPPAADESARVPSLSVVDHTSLVTAFVEASQVRQRFQFFAWTQGVLQRLIAHGILVCGLPRGTGAGMFFDYFHNVPLPASALARLCHPRDGVAASMLDSWRQSGGEPLVLRGGEPGTAHLCDQLLELGMGTTLAHGIPFEQSINGVHGFFAFVSLRASPGPRELLLLNLILPVIFSTYCRALTRDRVASRAPAEADSADSTLSEREVQILHWVREGKSNHEIGMVLSISPLTVKNHIQRILRKLGATNRTQAVAKAVAQRLLGAQ